MKIEDLKPAEGSTKRVKRIGRGVGSGHGKTSCKGHKGQKARSGGAKWAGFEGGQMPLQRRIPKRGFSNFKFSREYAIVSLDAISGISGMDVISPDILLQKKIIRDIKDGVKILGNGNLTRPITVRANAFSATALEKIQKAGGIGEVI